MAPPPVLWRLHEALFDGDAAPAAEALRRLGAEVQIVSGSKPEPLPAFSGLACAATVLQDARRLLGAPGLRLFFDRAPYKVSSWMPALPDSVVPLGAGGAFLPLAMAFRAPDALLRALSGPSGSIFVKPDSGGKPFAGQSFPLENFRSGLAVAAAGCPPDEPCFLAPDRPLGPVEWRFWIVGPAVAAVTPYSWDPLAAASAPLEPPFEILAAARTLAADFLARPDGAFVADFAETPDGPRLVEVNAASTSGLYRADPAAVFAALHAALLHESSDAFDGWDLWEPPFPSL